MKEKIKKFLKKVIMNNKINKIYYSFQKILLSFSFLFNELLFLICSNRTLLKNYFKNSSDINKKKDKKYNNNKNEDEILKEEKQIKLINMKTNKEKFEIVRKKQNNENKINRFLIFIILLIQIVFSDEKISNFRKILSVSEITLTLRGSGNQYILNNSNASFDKNFYIFDKSPDQILINGVLQNYTGNMVYNLVNEENIITLKFNDLLTDCSAMFSKLSNIIKIDLSKFDSSKVTQTVGMFHDCTSLISLNLNNFKTSSITSMARMFDGCKKITSLDLSSFDTSSVTDLVGIFSNCKSLLSLDLSNFNTSSVKKMDVLFLNCSSLKILNLNNFNTSSVQTFHGIFKFCTSLLSLNINNFDTSNAGNLNDMFIGCSSLISLNLINFRYTNARNLNRMFLYCKNDTIFCVSNSSTPKVIDQLVEVFGQDYTNNCSDICFEGLSTKIILEKKICISDCSYDDTHKFEYENICYETCPINTHISSDNHSCEIDQITNEIDNLSNDINFISNINLLVPNWDINKFFNGSYSLNYSNITIKDKLIEKIEDDIKEGNINLTNLILGDNDLIFKENDTIYQITSSDNQNNNEYEDISTIQLGECEKILKNKYNIDKDLPLIIFKVDYYLPGILIPVIGYDIFHPKNKTKLNLTYCKDEIINFKIPVDINEGDLFIYDPNSDYYNDECFSYTSDNGTDILLNDRHEEYNNNNLSLCENNCAFSGYNEDTNKVNCKCGIKSKDFAISKIISDENVLSAYNFTNKNLTSNIISMKCYYTLFTKEGLKTNIGNYILVFILIIFIILLILFYKFGYELLLYDINKLIKEGQKKKKVITKKRKTLSTEFKKSTKKVNQNNISNPIKKKKRKISQNSANNNNNNNQTCINTNMKSSKIDLMQERNFISHKNLQNIEVYKSKKNYINNNIEKFNDYELNSFTYKEALEYDKRNYFQYYFSLLKTKHPLIFAFVPINDYNSIIIKVSIFLLFFTIIYTVNTLFFNESTIHNIYIEGGTYNLIDFLPKIFFSFIISHILFIFIKYFALSERNIVEIKKNAKNLTKITKEKNCLVIKYVCFFIISLIFLILFWYYLSSFCAVFRNSQIFLIKNTIISLTISFIYPFLINLLPCAFRINSLNDINKSKECMYKISKILQFI